MRAASAMSVACVLYLVGISVAYHVPVICISVIWCCTLHTLSYVRHKKAQASCFSERRSMSLKPELGSMRCWHFTQTWQPNQWYWKQAVSNCDSLRINSLRSFQNGFLISAGKVYWFPRFKSKHFWGILYISYIACSRIKQDQSS